MVKHTLSHKSKLFFISKLWWLKGLYYASIHPSQKREYDYLKNLRNTYYQSYLEEHRKKTDSKETFILQGKVEVLDELLKL